MAPARAIPDVFHAIADPNRRRLLDLLIGVERPVQELVAQFDITFAAVSQHLRVLRETGLVSMRARGRQRLYTARPDALRQVYDWTSRYRDFWEDHLDQLGDYLDHSE